jgi:hypothetical protein
MSWWDFLTLLMATKPKPPPYPKPPRPPAEPPRPQPGLLARAWRWMRATGCLAGAGLLLVLATGAAGAQQQQQQPQRECFTVVMNHSTGGGSLGAVLLDKCTGKTWMLTRTNLRGGATTVRWFPITVETTEPTSQP